MSSNTSLRTRTHLLAVACLAVAACLLTMTVMPPSSAIYLHKADFGNTGPGGVRQQAWFSTFGFCLTTNDTTPSPYRWSHTCSGFGVGYDTTTVTQVAMGLSLDVTIRPNASSSSLFLTTAIGLLHPIALVLSLISLAVYPVVTFRPGAKTYLFVVAANMLALLASAVAFIFEYAFRSWTAQGLLVGAIPLSITWGSAAYMSATALFCQVVSCFLSYCVAVGLEQDGEGRVRLPSYEASDETDWNEKMPLMEKDLICIHEEEIKAVVPY